MFPGSFRGMPKRDDTETKLAGAGMAAGEEWKGADFAGDPAFGDDLREDGYLGDSGDDWDMDGEEIDDAVSAFVGLADELDADPDDEDLEILGGDDDVLGGGMDDEDFDLLGGDDDVLVADDEDFDLLDDEDTEFDDEDDWDDFDDDAVLEDLGGLDEF
jgi:hypothetical protein